MVAPCRCQEWQRAAVLLDQRRNTPRSGTDVVSFNAAARSHRIASGNSKIGSEYGRCNMEIDENHI